MSGYAYVVVRKVQNVVPEIMGCQVVDLGAPFSLSQVRLHAVSRDAVGRLIKIPGNCY